MILYISYKFYYVININLGSGEIITFMNYPGQFICYVDQPPSIIIFPCRTFDALIAP
jgi:hypothetical protein